MFRIQNLKLEANLFRSENIVVQLCIRHTIFISTIYSFVIFLFYFFLIQPLVDDILNAMTKDERNGSMAGTSAGMKISKIVKTPAELEDETEAQALREELDGDS
jgi:hypothetical protein